MGVRRGAGCTFAFRGSDDLTDWVSNGAGVFYATTVRGKRLHGGFVDEFNKLQSRISGDVAGCGSPTFVGHSLGGAMATVAANYYGKVRVGWQPRTRPRPRREPR